MPKFKEGDVVELKSGGVRMTVASVDNDLDVAIVECVWHNASGDEKTKAYDATVLKLSKAR